MGANFKRIGIFYLVALGGIALTIVASQVFIQSYISKQKDDSHVINVAGRQRMLSQKICKLVLQIQNTEEQEEISILGKELSAAAKLWENSHHGLQHGDSSLALEGNNSQLITEMFSVIETPFQIMGASVDSIVGNIAFNPTGGETETKRWISLILQHESEFLVGMNKIVFQYDKEARDKVAKLQITERFLFVFSLLIILLELLFIFRPIAKRVKSTIAALMKSESAARQMADQLGALNQELSQSHKKLESANQELREFAYVTSHDLKSPLRAIGSLVQWIKSDYKHLFDDAGKENLRLMDSRVKRMYNFIEGMLNFTRVGNQQEEFQKIDLHLLLGNLITHSFPANAGQKICIDNKMPFLNCQPLKMEQLFQNIIDNAIKYNDKEVAEVKIDYRDLGDKIEFSIADNGIGISDLHFDKIFQIFQTLQVRDQKESTGIGLSIVKKIIAIHQGQIWLKSELGKGTTFYFTIPKSTEETPALEHNSTT